jgi:protein-disulfide isomerase
MKKQQNELYRLILGIVSIVAVVYLIVHYVPAKSSTSDDSSVPAAAGETGASAKIDINGAPYKGDKNKAKVAVVEFSDFECPYCKQYADSTEGQIVSNFVDSGKIVYARRDYPLAFHDPAATTEAIAAVCVQNLGNNDKYFQMAKLLFDNSAQNGQGMSQDKLVSLAGQVGVNTGDFKSCVDTKKYADNVKDSISAAAKIGVTGTPSFVVGKIDSSGNVTGELLVGAVPYADFETAINKYL